MLFASLRSSALNDDISKQTTAEMDWRQVVGPSGLCRPLDEKNGFPSNNPHLAPCKGCPQEILKGCLLPKRGEAIGPDPNEKCIIHGQGRGPGGQGARGPGPAPQTHQCQTGESGSGRRCCARHRRVISVPGYREALYPPSPSCRDARPGASVGASSAHANGRGLGGFWFLQRMRQ